MDELLLVVDFGVEIVEISDEHVVFEWNSGLDEAIISLLEF